MPTRQQWRVERERQEALAIRDHRRRANARLAVVYVPVAWAAIFSQGDQVEWLLAVLRWLRAVTALHG